MESNFCTTYRGLHSGRQCPWPELVLQSLVSQIESVSSSLHIILTHLVKEGTAECREWSDGDALVLSSARVWALIGSHLPLEGGHFLLVYLVNALKFLGILLY